MTKISLFKLHRLPFASALISSFLAISCLQSTEDGGDATGFAKWQNQKPEVYQYTYHETCFCPPNRGTKYTVTATKDSVLKVVFFDSTIAYRDVQGYLMDSLFKKVEDKKRQKYDKGEFVYNDIYGYPQKVNIDYIEPAVDDEWGMVVDSFKVVSTVPFNSQGIFFQLNKTLYTIGETVKFETLFNQVDTLLIYQCGGDIPKLIQKKVNNVWTHFDAQICLANLPQDPLKIAPHTVFSDSYKTREDGLYRLQVQYFTKLNSENQTIIWSDSFSVGANR